jgi:hypothetical protein
MLEKLATMSNHICLTLFLTTSARYPRTSGSQALSFNNMTGGPLPASLGTLAALQDFDLESNHISGPLDFAIFSGLADSLVEIGLGSNKFTGPLPGSLCSINATNGPACDLSNNLFECPFPPQCAAVVANCRASCV